MERTRTRTRARSSACTRLISSLVVIGALALVAAGCGDEEVCSGSGGGDRCMPDPPKQTSTDVTPPTAPGGDVPAQLTVQLAGIGDKSDPLAADTYAFYASCTKSLPATCTSKLTCPVAADIGAAPRDGSPTRCAWLATKAGRDALIAKVPEHQMCTEIYGGPQTAHVTGTVDGTEVDSTFSRTNGCEIARWEAASQLWTVPPEPEGGVSGAPATPPEAKVVSDPPAAFDR